MIDKVDGISQTQDISSINSSKSMNTKESNSNDNKNKNFNIDQLSADELKEKTDDLNKIMETLEENLSFKLHNETNKIMVQVVNVKTQEIVKEMPPEEMLDLAAKIHEMVGLIIDEKV